MRKKDIITKLTVDNEIFTDQTDIANEFIKYFSNIGSDLDSRLPHNNLSPLQYITPNPHSFFLSPITITQCSQIIRSLKNTRTDVNAMPVKIFSSQYNSLAEPLTTLINASFSIGYFPKALKLARVTPVHKGGSKDDPSNYRPISSLPYLSKVFERCMTNKLTSFFDTFSIISKSQFGFQKNISTSDALFKLTEIIFKSLDSMKHHISILIDLKKAFDTMNHNILIQKLELYGIRQLPLKWIGSYLCNRSSCVGLGGTCSRQEFTNIGIPQGSIIGPILFLIYINDLPNVSPILDTTLFADDTTISVSDTNYDELIHKTNTELIKINDWTISNRLTVNVDKTETILVTNRPSAITQHSYVQLNGENIMFSPHCKFLGTFLDNKLNFDKQVTHIIGKLSRGAGILYKIKDQLPVQARINYYYGMLYPFMSYNILIWGSTYNRHIEPLFIQQKRIIRIIANAKFLDHTSPLFKKYEILKLNDIYKFHLLVHTHKAVSENVYNAPHDRNTRYRNLARPVDHRLTHTRHAVSHMGPKEWNKLPVELRNIVSLKCFKKHLKKYLMKDYDPDHAGT